MRTEKFIYKCNDCGKEYSQIGIRYLCPVCEKENSADKPPKGVLKIIYNKENYPLHVLNASLSNRLKERKYIDILPISSKKYFPKLKVGKTPLYKYKKLNNKKLGFNLYFKDESQNPTYSFKDRASYLVSAYAKENGIDTIVAASTGNAGSSLAGICASQKQKVVIMVPETAPLAKLTQIVMYGAKIIPVKGTYDDAFDLSIKATEKYGWYNRNTAYNPLTIEGKKIVSYELFEQVSSLNNYEHTEVDRVFVSVGDGVIISSVYKGFEEMKELGIIKKIPTIIGVQSEGSDNLSRNIDNNTFEIKPSNTIADSISVDIPRNFYMTQKFIKKYKGKFVTVSDDEIIKASADLSKNTGLFAEPAAATAFAGTLNYMSNNKIDANSNNVVLLTGSGLKDLKSVQTVISIPNAIKPDIKNLSLLI